MSKINKVVITKKEIERLINDYDSDFDFFKKELNKYKEEEYKEVYIKRGVIFVYDIYSKEWSMHFFNGFSLEKGFYNYSILEQVIPLFKGLDKDKIYNTNYDLFFKYNEELEVWEKVRIVDCRIRRVITLYIKELELCKPVNRKEFDKILLINELVS